jgi:DNA primase
MARINEETINEILSKTDILEVIGEKVTLSKQGKSYFGLCPFHSEKTPSFSVEPERKIYNCFSCGEKGNAITFLQKTSNLSFVEAIEDLAERANVNIDFTEFKKENPNARLYNINNDALNFYKLYLSNTKQGANAKSYLNKRGLTTEIINKFDLGLSPGDFDLLTKTLTAKGTLVSDLYDLGLAKQSKIESFYDLFRDRIIIPIKDEKGNTVAFSGRTYLDKDKDSPKYINSPQTKIFTKSNILYNLDNALNYIKQNNRVVLFEGYMDVIAAYRANIKDSVASMGTSLTKEQVRLIKRYTNNIVICYDGDPAGIEATSRAINLFTNEKMQIKIVMLPDRLDPDDYITKYSAEKLNHFINEQWIDGIEFQYRKNNMDIDFTKMLDIERFKKTVFDLIKNTSNTIIESYIKRLAEDVKISQESIRQDFQQYTKRNIQNITHKPSRKMAIDNKFIVAERKILNYFLQNFKYVEDFNSEFQGMFYITDIVRDIRIAIEDIYFNNDENKLQSIDFKQFEEALSNEQMQFFQSKVKYNKIELKDQEYLDFKEVLNNYLTEIQIEKWNEEISIAPTIQEKIKLAEYRDLKLKEDKRWTKKK